MQNQTQKEARADAWIPSKGVDSS